VPPRKAESKTALTTPSPMSSFILTSDLPSSALHHSTTTMPPLRPLRLLSFLRQPRLYSTKQVVTDNPIPANNPSTNLTEAPRSTSATNALPMTTMGAEDRALVEDPEEGEQKRTMQAPNRAGIWSRSQQPRATAMMGPRFEQTVMEDQVRPIPRLKTELATSCLGQRGEC